MGMGVTLRADPGLAEPCAGWAWKLAFAAGIEAAKWRCSLADCAWWRRSSSSADDADCVSVRQPCLSRAVATSSAGWMPHHFKPAFTVVIVEHMVCVCARACQTMKHPQKNSVLLTDTVTYRSTFRVKHIDPSPSPVGQSHTNTESGHTCTLSQCHTRTHRKNTCTHSLRANNVYHIFGTDDTNLRIVYWLEPIFHHHLQFTSRAPIIRITNQHSSFFFHLFAAASRFSCCRYLLPPLCFKVW